MIVEISAMPRNISDAFVKALYAILLTAMDNKVPTDITNNLKKWGIVATPFAARFGLKTYAFLFKEAAKGNELDEEKLEQFGKEIKMSFEGLDAEHDIPSEYLSIIKDCGSWFRTKSEGAYRRLEKVVSTLKESSLTNCFVKDIASQKPILSALKTMVKKLTGRSDSVLTGDETAKLKKKNPEALKEYLRLRKEFNAVWRNALQTIVRESGKPTIDYKDAMNKLAKMDLQTPLPKGFEGKIDDTGVLYTTKGKKINGVPSILLPVVTMNPDYDPIADDMYVFFASKNGGKKKADGYTVYYTVDYKKGSKKEGFAVADTLKKQIKSIRAKWVPLLKKGVGDFDGLNATVLEVILQSSARVGGKSADGKPGPGLTTVKVGNLKKISNGVQLAYSGKAGVHQVHTLLATDPIMKLVVRNMMDLVKGKKATDLLFSTQKKNGSILPATNISVNKLFKRLGAGEATVHKLRKVRGSLIFQTLMDKMAPKIFDPKKPISEADAVKYFKEITEAVGKQLGHVRTMKGNPVVTGATAIESYIDPDMMISYFNKLGMRLPKFLAKKVD